MATKTKALVTRKPVRKKVEVYQPPPLAPRGYNRAPALDPQTRSVLVNLEQQVKQFINLEERIDELADQVKAAENKAANVPEAWWRQLQFSISTLQTEFKARVPLLERQYAIVENVISRMDRLEQRMDKLEGTSVVESPGRIDITTTGMDPL